MVEHHISWPLHTYSAKYSPYSQRIGVSHLKHSLHLYKQYLQSLGDQHIASCCTYTGVGGARAIHTNTDHVSDAFSGWFGLCSGVRLVFLGISGLLCFVCGLIELLSPCESVCVSFRVL